MNKFVKQKKVGSRKEMLEELYEKYDKLQRKYGDKKLHSIYFGGKKENPKLCFVFMNPTAGNVAAEPTWDGPRYPWLGTKNVWKLFYKLDLIDEEIYEQIQKKKKQDWTKEFCEQVYKNIDDHDLYITNLAKCTQIDARPLKDEVFKNYLKLFEHFYDLLSNVNNNNLRESILFSYIEIENLLFNYVECTSKNFYELGFNDLKAILFSNSTINNRKC